MQRRKFIALIGGAAAWPLTARAQQLAQPVIGFLSGVSPSGAYASAVGGFRKGLAENGFTEGVNVAIEFRWAEGHYERLASMADDLVRRNVSVIFAGASNVGVNAAKAATEQFQLSSPPGPIRSRAGLLRASIDRPEILPE